MKDFSEILDEFLIEIEKNPNKDVEQVIIETASSFKDSDARLTENDIQEIKDSFICINELTQNLNDLKNAKSRKDWLLKRIDGKLGNLPFLNEKRKVLLLQSIEKKVEEVLNKHVKKSEEEGLI